jgi:hypothetical protein
MAVVEDTGQSTETTSTKTPDMPKVGPARREAAALRKGEAEEALK